VTAALLALALFAVSAVAGEVGIVTASRLNVRSGPGLEHPPIMVLEEGTAVDVLQVMEEWVNIAYQGREGFVKNRERYIRLYGAAPSSTGEPADLGRIRETAEDLADTIRRREAALEGQQQKEDAVIRTLDDTRRSLNESRRTVTRLRNEAGDLDEAIERTRTAAEDLSRRIRANEEDAARRLVALYKLNWLGRLHFLASAESVHELFLRETTLERILDQDRRTLEELDRHRRAYGEVLAEQERQRREKSALEKGLEEEIALLEEKTKEHRSLLTRIRKETSLQLAAIDALKAYAHELDRTVENLARRAGDGTAVATGSFGQQKGLLPLPVDGNIVSRFGPFRNEALDVKGFRSGIDIRADRGEPVRAVFGGKVLYAGWFKGYGNMLIIDHGDSFYTVYANNQDLFKNEEESVEAGEVIATVGDSGSTEGAALYFELRHHGKPVDPEAWIDQG
jgi:septal ring factor EnvC (AmiA/AmiB activator)